MIEYKSGRISESQMDDWIRKAVNAANGFKSGVQTYLYYLFVGDASFVVDLLQLVDELTIYVGMGSFNRPIDHLISSLLALDFKRI